MNSRAYFLKKYFVYPFCWSGSMINSLGITAFGIKKAAEFFFGKEKDLTDKDMSAAFAIFLLCTFNIMRRTRMPGLRSNILKEQYYEEEFSRAEENKQTTNEEDLTNSCWEEFGNVIASLLKLFGRATILTNFINNFLNSATLYDYVYLKIYHSDRPTNEIAEDLFAFTIAATAIGTYVNFNISKMLLGAENVGNLIKRKSTKDNTYYKTAGLLTLNAMTIPFMAYLSSRHALPRIPWIGPLISDNTNLYLSIFSSFLFTTTRTCTVGHSSYDFFAKPHETEWNLDKLFTYITGLGESLGTSIGTLVAYCHLLKEGYEYFVGSVDDADNFWDFDDFIKNFGWGWFTGGLAIGTIAGFVNFLFSTIQGLEKAKKIENRLQNEFKPTQCLPQKTFNMGLFACCRANQTGLRQPLLSADEKSEHTISFDQVDPVRSYNPPTLNNNIN